MISAIVIVAPEFGYPEIRDEKEDSRSGDTPATGAASQSQSGTALVMVEVLGRSVVTRLFDELWRAGINTIPMFGNVFDVPDFDSAVRSDRHPTSVASAQNVSAQQAWSRATQHWMACRQSGAEAILVIRLGAYVEWDFKDALQFHREQGRPVTRAFDHTGPLDLWIIDPTQITGEADLLTILSEAEIARYLVRGYVNRLEQPRDLRRLVVDALSGRCGLRPQGAEIRPGVWLDEEAQVHRDARIVAPAFIGRGAAIAEQCLITRCSSVESNCQIDYGTVVEDSSILSNTYVGIGLDLSHSIVDGNNLLNLERSVTLEIADPCVIRQNRVPREGKNFRSPTRFGSGGIRLAVEDGLR